MKFTDVNPVLALRAYENREYSRITGMEERPPLHDEYLVMLAPLPPPPKPRTESAQPHAVICCGSTGNPARWGWIGLEDGTKEAIGRDLEEFGAEPGCWYLMTLKVDPETVEAARKMALDAVLAGDAEETKLINLEGSCPICRTGEVGKLADDFECGKCGRLFCGKCGGVKGPAHENVAACSCEGRTL